MKKFVRVLALMLVASMLCVMLVACSSKPADNPEDAVAALKENGYTIVYESDEVVSAKKGDDFISIYWFDNEDDANELYEEAMELKEEAEEALEKLKDELKEAQDELDDMEEGFLKDAAELVVAELEEEIEEAELEADAVVGKSGNMVWMGTKDAVKAAK